MASKPFGQVLVAAGGTPARATANQQDPTARVGCQSITFEVRPANTGLIYIQQGTGADDRTTRARTLAILPAPASPTQGPFASYTISSPLTAAGFNAADYYIDASVNGDGVIISAIQN